MRPSPRAYGTGAAAFQGVGFRDIEGATGSPPLLAALSCGLPEEQGAASPGQAFIQLPEVARRAVREKVQRDLGDTLRAARTFTDRLWAEGPCRARPITTGAGVRVE